jgi:hypothetical protein
VPITFNFNVTAVKNATGEVVRGFEKWKLYRRK